MRSLWYLGAASAKLVSPTAASRPQLFASTVRENRLEEGWEGMYYVSDASAFPRGSPLFARTAFV